MEGFQLWINLPAHLKMSKPSYQDIKSSKIPEILTDDGILIKVISGEVYSAMGAVTQIYAESEYLDITVPEGVSFEYQLSRDRQAFIYVFKGMGIIGEGKDQMWVSATSLAVFSEGHFCRVLAEDGPLRFSHDIC